MSDVTLTVQDVVRTGLTPAYTGSLSTGNTYYMPNDGRTFLHFKKTGAGDCTVTVETPNTVDGLAITDRTVTVVASTGDKMIGPFPAQYYNQPGTQNVKVTINEATGLSVAALRVS